jgi:hypothetical protein
MLDIIQEGMLVIDPNQRYRIDLLCTELSDLKNSLQSNTGEFREVQQVEQVKAKLSPNAVLAAKATASNVSSQSIHC